MPDGTVEKRGSQVPDLIAWVLGDRKLVLNRGDGNQPDKVTADQVVMELVNKVVDMDEKRDMIIEGFPEAVAYIYGRYAEEMGGSGQGSGDPRQQKENLFSNQTIRMAESLGLNIDPPN